MLFRSFPVAGNRALQKSIEADTNEPSEDKERREAPLQPQELRLGAPLWSRGDTALSFPPAGKLPSARPVAWGRVVGRKSGSESAVEGDV